MTTTIWKYPIDFSDGPFISLPDVPIGAHVMTLQVQGGTPCLWLQLNPNNERREMNFIVVGTGHIVPLYAGRYIGTWQESTPEGVFVWHLFEDMR